jgi:hypothetical protein
MGAMLNVLMIPKVVFERVIMRAETAASRFYGRVTHGHMLIKNK